MGCRASAFSVSKRHFPCPMGPQEDMTEQERADPTGRSVKAALPACPPPLESARTWGGVGLGLWAGGGAGGQRGAELTHLALIRTLTAFYVFSGWRKAGDANTFTGRRFFFKKKKERETRTWTVVKREREW